MALEQMDVSAQTIRTERLLLIPHSLEFSEALADGDRARAAALLGAELGEWPEAPELQSFAPYPARLRNDPGAFGWHGRAIVLPGAGSRPARAIGSVNLKGPPTPEGRVEIGYTLEPAYRGRGYAREAVVGVLRHVLAKPEVGDVKAETQYENVRSVQLLEALGFVATGAPSAQHPGYFLWLLTRDAYERQPWANARDA